MRFHALACDYDGTLATHGRVGDEVLAALKAYRHSGRKLLMVTGRRLEELLTVFPHTGLFDLIVAENGALLYRPATKEEVVLADPPPPEFVRNLSARGVGPIEVGRVIVATWEPHETVALEVIRDMGLGLQVILNKGAVMILPTDVSKASGLAFALQELGVSPHNAAAVGDAENDHALLMAAECGVAVSNAVDALKVRADVVTAGDHGAGVIELINQILADDLASWTPKLGRHAARLGVDAAQQPHQIATASGNCRLIAQSAESLIDWMSTFLTSLTAAGYQWTLIMDGEIAPLIAKGAVKSAETPVHTVNELLAALKDARRNPVLRLGLQSVDQPVQLCSVLSKLGDFWRANGRPHWVACLDANRLLAGMTRLDQCGPIGFSLLLAHTAADELPLIGFDAITYHEDSGDGAVPAPTSGTAIRFRRVASGLQFDSGGPSPAAVRGSEKAK